MKRFPRLFFLVLTFALAAPLLANDWIKKDSEALAKEARKIAADLRKEAEYFQASATKAGRSLTADEQKYVSYTIEEAELLEKSHEAWDKNQKRMADRYREKAAEVCQKRGAMAQKLKLWEKKPEAEVPADRKPDNAARIAEIERQQAELERQKKELLEAGRN
jgi:hypothetical protein